MACLVGGRRRGRGVGRAARVPPGEGGGRPGSPCLGPVGGAERGSGRARGGTPTPLGVPHRKRSTRQRCARRRGYTSGQARRGPDGDGVSQGNFGRRTGAAPRGRRRRRGDEGTGAGRRGGSLQGSWSTSPCTASHCSGHHAEETGRSRVGAWPCRRVRAATTWDPTGGQGAGAEGHRAGPARAPRARSRRGGVRRRQRRSTWRACCLVCAQRWLR